MKTQSIPHMRAMLTVMAAVCLALFATPAWSGSAAKLAADIEAAMGGEHRSEENRARNRYRHPVGTLMFLGLRDDMTVMEIWPGGGWYTEILAPVLRERGRLVIAGWDPEVPDQPDYRYRLQAAILEKFAETPDIYDRVGVAGWSPPQSASLGEADSIDMILTFRNVHGWIGEGLAETAFAEFARVLKPGGVLGVVQHRAATAGSGAAERGYVSEATVIGLAAQAGLFLEAKSEVNANPKDTGEHDPGVWALPPSLAKCREFESPDEFDACAAPYRKIGESDRMTLKFRKPAG